MTLPKKGAADGQNRNRFLQDNDKYIEAFFAKNIPCVVLSRGFCLLPR